MNPIAAARAAQAAQKRALASALTGTPAELLVHELPPVSPPARPPAAQGGLDGGARTIARRPESHAETLARLLRTGEADVGHRL